MAPAIRAKYVTAEPARSSGMSASCHRKTGSGAKASPATHAVAFHGRVAATVNTATIVGPVR
ncbi:hypothetical protein ACFWA6_03180 [Streptomyces sp. NPDC060020]|uniref:hypothetical protein n=1 Tax=Streptomyces sp. NPDC060020 TaxID=3347038 RepID=UPI00369EB3CC